MNIKNLLERGFKLDLEIRQLNAAKENIVASAKKNNATKPKIREFNRLIFVRINILLDVCCEISDMISVVDDVVVRTILTARYINFKTFEEIAEDTDLDLRWVYRLHNKGVEIIENSENVKKYIRLGDKLAI